MIKIFIIVSSDDLQPLTLDFFENFWKRLKEKHEGLKVDFFVSPFNQEFGQDKENDISTSEKFKKFFEENKEWISIHPHGFSHCKNPENLENYDRQKELIMKSLDVLKPYIDMNCLIYKSPFYKMNDETINVLHDLGFVAYSQWWGLNLLKVNKRPVPKFVELPSHSSLDIGGNPDNINKIYDKLDKDLTFLENAGFQYKNFIEIIKESL